ncbi:hypothetical protein MFIFM68171_09378 [Madurella fahalii]|uniref:Uncharacterized protein n=1 Tax=Madurella fahalii TaxID=1157608 RepID=A0ABQ0GN18_9PEZI
MIPKFVALVLLGLYLPLSLAHDGHETGAVDAGTEEWDDSMDYMVEDEVHAFEERDEANGPAADKMPEKTCYFAAGCTDGNDEDPSIRCPPDHTYMGVETEHNPLTTILAPPCPKGQGHPICCPKDVAVSRCGWQGEPGKSEYACFPEGSSAVDPSQYESMEDPGVEARDAEDEEEYEYEYMEDPGVEDEEEYEYESMEDPNVEARDAEDEEEYEYEGEW